MSIPVQCPGCRSAANMPEAVAGKVVRCRKCRRSFRVAAAPSAIQSRTRVRDGSAPHSHLPGLPLSRLARRFGGPRAWILGGIALAVLTFIMGFGSAWTAKAQPAAPAAQVVVMPAAPGAVAPPQAAPDVAAPIQPRPPTAAAPKMPAVVYLPSATHLQAPASHQDAARRAMNSLDGRWRVVRITSRKDRLEQGGIGHFGPELLIQNGEFHWTGQFVLGLVDAPVQQRIAAMDPDRDSVAIQQSIMDWLGCVQQEQARIGCEVYDRGYVERKQMEARERGKQEECATATIDSTPGVGAIDFRIQGGPLNGRIQRGIYRLRGDTLEICVNGPATARRPTGFGPLDVSDGSVLFTYQRVAPGTQVELANCTVQPSPDGCEATAFFNYNQ